MKGPTAATALASLCACALLSNSKAMPMEGNNNKLGHDASLNAVPRLGKKAALPREMPSFTSNYLPGSSLPEFLKGKPLLKRAPESPEVADIPREFSWHLGKRAPWTGAWANIMWKPQRLLEQAPKRSAMAVPSEWEWNNFGRQMKGFRYADPHHDFLSRDVLYKRADMQMDTESQKSKRVPEVPQEVAVSQDEGESGAFQFGPQLFDESNLYPHDREDFTTTILTRVQ